MSAYMIVITKLLETIASKGKTRDDVAWWYAEMIKCNYSETAGMAHSDEVKRVNQAILKRWRPSSLDYIKKQAWTRASASGATAGVVGPELEKHLANLTGDEG